MPLGSLGFVLAVLVYASPSSARLIATDEGVEKLVEKADVVMIGHVLAVHGTPEESTLRGIAPTVNVRGVETTFFADAVLKGATASRVVVLHHYRLADSRAYGNGPLLVHFSVDARRQFLLLLKREADGRYAPVGGQTDPAFSIRRLMGALEGLDDDRAGRIVPKPQPGRTKETELVEDPKAPIVFQFMEMVTDDGIRKRAKMQVLNTTPKAVISYGYKALFFKEDGSIADSMSGGTSSAVGQVALQGHSEQIQQLRGETTDNYETVRAKAVVTAVRFADGTEWRIHEATTQPTTMPALR